MRSKDLFRFCVRGVLGVCLVTLWMLPSSANAANRLKIGTGTAKDGNVADVPLLVSGDKDVEAFVMVFDWTSSQATGVDLIPSTAAGEALANAELVVKRVEGAYMILSVVMDVDGQGGEVIPAGTDIRVGTAKIRCKGPAEGNRDTTITLVDDKYATVDGGPKLSNIIVSEGLSIGKNEGLSLVNGKMTCQGEAGPGPDEVIFACGATIGSSGKPGSITGSRGDTKKVNFYYKAPGDGPGNKNKIQGFSMGVKYHCDLFVDPASFDLSGGALDAVNAEFVHLEVDNVGADDPCEFTLGVLVDAVAPFDGRTLPATSAYSKLFSLEFDVENDAECGECLRIYFGDDIDGNGIPYLFNLVSINFFSQAPKLENCSICVEPPQVKFVRGDCNFTFGYKHAVDISDAAAMVGYIFLQGDAHFAAPCEKSCDANDDGRLNAADVVFILSYMFVPGSPLPPYPGPINPGFDPTPDSLTCDGGKPQC